MPQLDTSSKRLDALLAAVAAAGVATAADLIDDDDSNIPSHVFADGFDARWWGRKPGRHEMALYERECATPWLIRKAIVLDMQPDAIGEIDEDDLDKAIVDLVSPPPTPIAGIAPPVIACDLVCPKAAAEELREDIPEPTAVPSDAPIVMQSAPVPKRPHRPHGSRTLPGGGHDYQADAVENMIKKAVLPPRTASRLRMARARHATATTIAQLERLGAGNPAKGIPQDIRESRIRFLRAQYEYLGVVCQERGNWEREGNHCRQRLWTIERTLRTGSYGVGNRPYWEGQLAHWQTRREELDREHADFESELKQEREYGHA